MFSTFFDVKLADQLENGHLADFLSRKCSKALIYKALCCNGHDALWGLGIQEGYRFLTRFMHSSRGKFAVTLCLNLVPTSYQLW